MNVSIHADHHVYQIDDKKWLLDIFSRGLNQGLRVQRSARNGVLEIIRRVRRNSPIARKRRHESWNGLRDRHQWVRIRVYGEFCPNWPKLSTQNLTRCAGKLTRGAQPGSRKHVFWPWRKPRRPIKPWAASNRNRLLKKLLLDFCKKLLSFACNPSGYAKKDLSTRNGVLYKIGRKKVITGQWKL